MSLRPRFLFALAAAVIAAGAFLALRPGAPTAPAVALSPPPQLRCTGAHAPMCVLFVGNSYTYVNDLPQVFARLAASGGHPVRAATLAQGGWTLADHERDPETAVALDQSRWDVVVLQEQSQIPASEQLLRDQTSVPARGLVRAIRRHGGRPLLFETWAHEAGWPEAGLDGYAAMQAGIDRGYATLGRALHVPVAPVGDAWTVALRDPGHPALWQPDGSHPTTAGTYLAACVFYASIFGESPAGLRFTGGLPAPVATQLQDVAAHSAG